MKSKGLGDTIEWVIETTGLSHFKPKNCNCDKRKEMLNKIVPYGNTKKENNGTEASAVQSKKEFID